MESSKILNADILDILFENRNKQYGAYDLRKAYGKRLAKALIITAAIVILAFLYSIIVGFVEKNKVSKVFDTGGTIIICKLNPPDNILPPLPPPPPKVEPQKIKTIQFTPPKIVEDNEVNEKIQEINEEVKIDVKSQEGDKYVGVVQAPVEEKNTQVAKLPKKDDDEDLIFRTVEVEAAFPGGNTAWASFLQKNLDTEVPANNGAAEGTYTVVVKFVVSKEGSLSDITCENDPGYGICNEAIRVIKKTKNWVPAIQNGRNVNAYRRQPITFVVQTQ